MHCLCSTSVLYDKSPKEPFVSLYCSTFVMVKLQFSLKSTCTIDKVHLWCVCVGGLVIKL